MHEASPAGSVPPPDRPDRPARAARLTLRRRLFLLAFRARVMLFYPLLLPILAVMAVLGPLLGAQRRRRVQQRILRLLCGWFLRVNRIDLRIEGLERLQAAARGPLVLVCNHNSRFDAYILLATIPLPFKLFWSNTAHITTEGYGPVAYCGRAWDVTFDHDKNDRRRTLAEFRRAEEYVRAGGLLSLFPEGEFSPDGRVGAFGSASLKLALRAGAPLLPVVMLDTRATFETRWQQRRGRCPVRVRFLEPVDTRGLDGRDIPLLQARLAETMNRHVGASALPAATP